MIGAPMRQSNPFVNGMTCLMFFHKAFPSNQTMSLRQLFSQDRHPLSEQNFHFHLLYIVQHILLYQIYVPQVNTFFSILIFPPTKLAFQKNILSNAHLVCFFFIQ